MNDITKAVVSVVGKDRVGILASVAEACAKSNANVIEVTQSVMSDYFCMVMVIDISDSTKSVDQLQSSIIDKVPDMSVYVMHEDIFNSMHRI